MPPRVVWYGDRMRHEIQADLDRALTACALQIEAQAKVNITDNGQIDTGFLRSSGYTIAPGENNFNRVDPAGMYTSPATGTSVRRDRAPSPVQPARGEAVVGFAADYAAHQETVNSYLYRAAENVAGSDAEQAILRVVRHA